MSIRIASLLILFALVIVPDTCMPAHAEITTTPETPPIRTTAPTSTPDFQQGEYVRGDICREKKGDTWVIRTEVTEDNANTKRLTRFKWVAPNNMIARRHQGKEGWCYRRAGGEPVFEDGVPMKGTECHSVGGNVWHTFLDCFDNKQKEVMLFGTELNGMDYRNHLGRCYYVKNVDEGKQVWNEKKARMKEEKACKKVRDGRGGETSKPGGGSRKGKEVVKPRDEHSWQNY